MKGLLKLLISLILGLQILLIMFIVFGKFLDKDEKIGLTLEDNFDNIFLPQFTISEIDDEINSRITGVSFIKNDEVSRDDLRYLQIAYYNFDGEKCNGEMIVNQKVAEEVIEIFKVLYKNKYRIDKIKLIDDYDADKFKAIEDNDTFSFCSNDVEDLDAHAAHALGLAIELNPLQNPELINDVLLHPGSKTYLDRNRLQVGMINYTDICVKTFEKYGWTWGGKNERDKDYGHFEKKLNEEEVKEEYEDNLIVEKKN